MMLRRLGFSAVLLLSGVSLARADLDAAPYASMRTLQVLQEQIAHGDLMAQAAQGKLMEHIADGFLAAPPDSWKDPRNSRAAILFLLSGGRPAVIRTILKTADFPAETDRMLKGALAYAEGQDDVARALLDPVAIEPLPALLGAHMSLVKANLFADEDPEKAIRLLDAARLLAPGTLIEEAALRRDVFLLFGRGAVDRGLLLARQYMRRFGASTYAESFKQRFAGAAATMAMAGQIDQFAKLDTLMRELPPGEARSFYLSVARIAVMAGKTEAAAFAADKALALSPPNSREASRAKLYEAASVVVSEETDRAVADLKSLDPKSLSAEDASLRTAALAIAGAIRVERPANGKQADDDDAPKIVGNATLDHALSALNEADRLLASTNP